MKRLFILGLALIATLFLKGQTADHWNDDPGIEIFREPAIVHQGDFSAGIIVNSEDQANCDLINDAEIPVNSGESFKVSFWGVASLHIYVRVFFYWQGANLNFTSEYLGPGTETWEEFTYEDVVPAGATGLKLGLRFYDIPGFQPGEAQYIDDITFESPVGNLLSVANGDFENWAIVKPEPSGYPANFTGFQKGFSALLTWDDASGGQLPDGYLILGALDQMMTIPEDGIFYPDDLDFSDGAGAINLPFGTEQYSFHDLEPLSNYHFIIFPYTNSGPNIDYKTGESAPEVTIGIPDVVVIDAQNFDTNWGDWETISVDGDQVWNRENNYGMDGTPCARISGNSGGNTYANQDWIISPAMNFTLYENEYLSFYTSAGFITEDDQFSVKISTDYSGNGDPLSATWVNLNPVLPDGSINWNWVNSGEIDLSGFDDENVFVAFVYECGTTSAATWQVDNILFAGEAAPAPEPSNYPMDFTAVSDDAGVVLSWTDAVGEIVPVGYLVLGSDEDNILPPSDGIPALDDEDFSDGSVAMNIPAGTGEVNFLDLIYGKTYYFKIFPFSNSGNLIDYKTDGMPPSTSVYIQEPDDILFTDFNENMGGWTPFSQLGDQVWNRSNNSGIEGSPCALITNSAGGNFDNTDWLLSPPVDLTESGNIALNFYNAGQYNEQGISLKISTDYEGAGNPNDFAWVDLSGNVIWSAGEFQWTFSGDILLNEYSGSTIYLAFIYTSTVEEATTWGIDDVTIRKNPVLNEPTNYPTQFAANGETKQIIVSWKDAVGEIVPWGYLLQLSDKDEFILPENGIPMEDDTDFSDGYGRINVLPETEEYTFSNLADSTTYFVTIIPYSNADEFIRYKTEPAPPKTSAMTAPPDGIFHISKSFKFNIYPNPGNGLFWFKSDKIITDIRIYSITGTLVFGKVISHMDGQLNLNHVEKGIYLVVFEANDGTLSSQRIAIQ